jgi:hypothetical protein
MARISKSLGIPQDGFPHRDHRSKKNRNVQSKLVKKRIIEFEMKIEAEVYDMEMRKLREQWREEENIDD